jgi:hypothetical protein
MIWVGVTFAVMFGLFVGFLVWLCWAWLHWPGH